jgi:hypothetical protein
LIFLRGDRWLCGGIGDRGSVRLVYDRGELEDVLGHFLQMSSIENTITIYSMTDQINIQNISQSESSPLVGSNTRIFQEKLEKHQSQQQ